MTLDEQEQLLDRLSELAEYYDKPKAPAQLAIYLQALDDLPFAAVMQATVALVNTSTFFPKVAEIRQLVEGHSESHAELAWLDLLREIRRVGYTGRPDLPEATLATMERMWGSWVRLCETLPGEGPGLHAWAKRFRETYAALATRERMALPEARRPQLGPSPALVADGDTRSAQGSGMGTNVPAARTAR